MWVAERRSVLEGEQIERIFSAVRERFGLGQADEITIEANPGTVTRGKLQSYKRVGINRISFGLQSANNEELKMLGRIHTYEEFLESYRLAREEGFTNINVDLISAIPKQTLESWKRTVDAILELNPEHISAYSLIVEAGTPFEKLVWRGRKQGSGTSRRGNRACNLSKDKRVAEKGGI